MPLLITSLPRPVDAPPATQPSHLRAYALYREAAAEVAALEARDVPAIRTMQSYGTNRVLEEEGRYTAALAELETDIERLRLSIDYLHARRRQADAYERFMTLLDQAAEPERAALHAELAAGR